MKTGFTRRKFGELEVLSVDPLDSFPRIFHGFGLRHREGTGNRVWKEKFLGSLGLSQANFAEVEQVHGNRVLEAMKPGVLGKADALVTLRKGLAIGVKTADCIPLLVYDPVSGAVAAVHAGWRGLVSGIIENSLKKMEILYGTKAGDIVVGIGPFIRNCCYSVGKEVAKLFEEEEIKEKGGKLFLDMERVVLNKLVKLGVVEENIGVVQLCTCCREDMFYSHRRCGNSSGRMYSLIVRKQ